MAQQTQATSLVERAKALFAELDSLDLTEKIEVINVLRAEIHRHSPFVNEPVDLVQWVPADSVIANTYNPNHVAPPEMELLYISIKHDGYTQPIVAYAESEYRLAVDGEHRTRVGKERKDIRTRLYGYLPIVTIDKSLENRMASTIRHNRARGKHEIAAMSTITTGIAQVWSDARIAKELGMEAEEVLRLQQQAGVAEYYRSREYSRSWEWVPDASDKEEEEVNDEPAIGD